MSCSKFCTALGIYCLNFFKNSYWYLVHRYWNSWIDSGYFHCGCPQKKLCAFACMEWCCFPLENLVVFITSCNSCFELSKIKWVRLMERSACLSAPAIRILKWVMHEKLPDVLAGSCWKGRHSYCSPESSLSFLHAPSASHLALCCSMIHCCRERNWQKTYFTKIEKC